MQHAARVLKAMRLACRSRAKGKATFPGIYPEQRVYTECVEGK